jgi:diguanylate cyclase (GGDEF)-like protein
MRRRAFAPLLAAPLAVFLAGAELGLGMGSAAAEGLPTPRAAVAPGTVPRTAPGTELASALRGEPIFSVLGLGDGLPSAEVRAFAQDGLGFAWFGTACGLARYDGRLVRAFRHEPFDGSSLPNDDVRALLAEGDSLWVGSRGGLARLDLRTERFSTCSGIGSDPTRGGGAGSVVSTTVTCLARDGGGRLWAGTESGLYRVDSSTLEAELVSSKARSLPVGSAPPPSGPIRALAADKAGRLWIGSGEGLVGYDYATGAFRAVAFAQARAGAVAAILEEASGKLWVGFEGGGLATVDPESGASSGYRRLPVDRLTALSASPEGLIFVGTARDGLLEYDPVAKVLRRYRRGSQSGALSSDTLLALGQDAAGGLWACTDRGADRLDPSWRGFEAVPTRPGGLPPGDVDALLVDGRGSLWIASRGEGLSRLDPASGEWRRFVPRSTASPSGVDVLLLFEDARGELWAGTDRALSRYDRASLSFSSLPLGRGAGPAPVRAMAECRGGLWVGTAGAGIYRLDEAGAVVARYANDSSRPSSLPDDAVSALLGDASGRLWVGTARGLARLEEIGPDGEARFARYRYDPSSRGGPSSDSISELFADSRGIVWVGSEDGGIMRYEPETDSFISFTERDGLPSNSILRILEDGSGDIWVATRQGIAVYDRAGGRFRKLSVSGALDGEEFLGGACRAPDGALYFGGDGRLFRFYPGRYRFNTRRPPLAFASIAAKGKASLGPFEASALRRLDLGWRGNSVTFTLAALDFRDPGRDLYSYRLEGFDAEWSTPGPARRVEYTNLPGGEFLFRARAANNDGLWNEEGIVLPLRVRFRPWGSPLALLAYALLLGGGGAAVGVLGRRKALAGARAEADALRVKLVAAAASIESAAIVDELTGLPNRRKAMEHLELAVSRAFSRRLDLAVLLVDIDRFKPYNDLFGRAAGDECLRRVAAVLSSRVRRSSDLVARIGGEEFLVVLEETDLDGALAEGEILRAAVEGLAIPSGPAPAGGGEVPCPVSVSVGCASIQPASRQSPQVLVAAAESALMAAKTKGRNRVSS